MDSFERYFTHDEANATLDELRPEIEGLMAARERIVAMQPELESGLEKALGNGGSRATGELMALMQRIRQTIQAIQTQGVQVKDIDRGLLDFPSRREGREIFLCWQYGEPSVQFWHGIEAGFAGRQPI